MAEIFISYSREDRSRVESFAKALEDQGWTVWWDRIIPPGKTFDQVIEDAITAAKCVVVLWSKTSVKSDWVKEEATRGKQRGILIPAMIDPVEPPIGFGLIQAADLTDWETHEEHPGYINLLNAIETLLGPTSVREENAEPKTPTELFPKQEQGEGSEKKSSPLIYPKRVVGIGLILMVVISAIYLYVIKGDKSSSENIRVSADEEKLLIKPKPITNSIGMKFVYIPPGSFTMGSPEHEKGRDKNELQHRVTLTQGVFMQTTEVTQGQWKTLMDGNPSNFLACGDDCPVDSVSWEEAQSFIKKLNSTGNYKYRLPYEAEWEYAARAGKQTTFSYGSCLSTEQANFDGRSSYSQCTEGSGRGKTIEVGTLQANSWGLFDMHGNVSEWCQDWYDNDYYFDPQSSTDPKGPKNGSYRVTRGGSWLDGAKSCRSADRSWAGIDDHYYHIGFRLVLSEQL